MTGGHGAGADGAARSPRAQRQRQGEEHLRTRAEDKHDERSQRRGQCSGSTYAHHAEIHCDVDSHPCWVVITILWGPTKSVLVVLLVVRAWAAQRSQCRACTPAAAAGCRANQDWVLQRTAASRGLAANARPTKVGNPKPAELGPWHQLPNANSTNELRHGCGIRPT